MSPKWEMPERYYKKTLDSISLFIINTENFDPEQARWLRQELENGSQKFQVVLGHRPILTFESTHASDIWLQRENLQEIICQEAELYVAGHSHVLEDVGRLTNCSARQLVSGGGGAWPRQILDNSPNEFSYEGNGYLILEEENGKLTYAFYSSGNEYLYIKSVN